jgi:N-methylhydantoinase B
MVTVKSGQILGKISGGGGGVGNPAERDPEAVLSDVINEWVTVGHARDTYKVVVDEEARTIDWDATNELRAAAAPADAT